MPPRERGPRVACAAIPARPRYSRGRLRAMIWRQRTYRPRHAKRRPSIARAFNRLCDSEAARALANLIDWLDRIGFALGLLALLLKLFL